MDQEKYCKVYISGVALACGAGYLPAYAGLLLDSISQSSPSEPPSSRLRLAIAPCIPPTLAPVVVASHSPENI
jgi:hypothetical protein